MITPPNDPKKEAAVAVVKGLVSAIPLAGGFLSEIGNLYLNPLEKRKQLWIEDVSSALNQIKEQLDILPEKLQEDEAFISTLYQATEIALRSHQSQKRAALRNALVSSVSSDHDYDIETRMVRYIDELSITHINILKCLDMHAGQFSRYEKLDQIFAKCNEIERKKMDRIVFRSILQDLESRFLIILGDIEDFSEFKSKQDAIVTEKSSIQPMTVTGLGRSFLTFIRADQL